MKEKKVKYYSCIVCGKKAVGCYSPDMDIEGLCYCKKHKDEVFMKYLEIINGVQNEFKKKEHIKVKELIDVI